MSTPLSVEDLYNLSDDDVKITVRTTFLAQLKNSASVKGVFFAQENTLAPPAQNSDFVDNIACGLVCSAIAHSSLYGFSKTVDQQRVDNYWQSQLSTETAVQVGQALYEQAFPDHCKSPDHSFSEYLNGHNRTPVVWAADFARHVTGNDFVNVEINKLIAGQTNWLEKLNLVFYKLHRLDSSVIPSVLQVWTKAYPDKGIVQNWQAHNYIPKANFQSDEFVGQVNQAISVEEEEEPGRGIYRPPGGYPPHGGPAAGGGVDIDIGTITGHVHGYGKAVVNFLAGKPSSLGLTTGQSPDNERRVGGIVGCFIAGTPVLLANGETIPIEQVRENHEILAKDGAVSMHSDERVIIYLERDDLIYGFNEHEPFFSAGHLFWTRDGWKALEPAIALEENPTRQVGKLQVGDVVFRVSTTDPLFYEEVPVQQFTARMIPAGERLYGLHLHGQRSYHVHGYCVGMNYPVLTEKRLTDGFARLTPAERRHVAKQLAPIMPLLKKAIGGFIEAPLQRALITSHIEEQTTLPNE